MKTTVTLIAAALVCSVSICSAQSLGEIAKKAAEAKAAKEKDAKAPVKTITNKDLKADPTSPAAAKPLEPITLSKDAKTQDALTALRAVQSVLDGGANAAEFKKYYLEAKVKIDALPPTAENAPLRAISDFYADAVTLSIASQIEEMSSVVVRAFKARYANDPHFTELFRPVPDEGVSRYSLMTRTERERASISMRGAQQILLIRASEILAAIRAGDTKAAE